MHALHAALNLNQKIRTSLAAIDRFCLCQSASTYYLLYYCSVALEIPAAPANQHSDGRMYMCATRQQTGSTIESKSHYKELGELPTDKSHECAVSATEQAPPLAAAAAEPVKLDELATMLALL